MSSELGDDLTGLEIAVIGMACQFPGAPTVSHYWQNLLQSVCSLQHFSVDELVSMGQDRAQVSRDEFVRVHGAVAGFDQFDAGFFGINPRESDVLDPQHRLLFKVLGHALEDAGYDPSRTAGTIGVFAGCSGNTYYADQVLKNAKVQLAMSAHQAKVLNLNDFLATRASYIFGLTGPAFTVQAACATSLVAVAMGCQSLLSGACDLALAGGSSLTLPQHFGYAYQEGMILSPDGACRAFDAKAAGTLKGDGAGVVVLKRLADALADGDHIEAVIKGFATNNDGQDKIGYLAPGLNGQKNAILAAQMMAGVEGDAIEYIEAHGTATPMGDPIEVAALTQAFQTSTHRKHFCGIGSVKTNIGHLDAAAGVAGLIKAILTVKHGVIPASLNFNAPNPKIDFANSPFYVANKKHVWPSKNCRRAGVSSFGMGGSNVHMIIEQPPVVTLQTSEQPQVIPFSAAAPQALLDQAEQLADFLETSKVPLATVAATLQQGRRVLKYRRTIVAADNEMAIAALRNWRLDEIVQSNQSPAVVFLMPGQGAQYVGMAADLYHDYPSFKAHIDDCAQWLKPYLPIDLRDVLFAKSTDEAVAEQLKQTAVTQPALFTISTGLAKLWQRFGVQPGLLLGHSIGELAAAHIAGVFSLEDGLRLAMMRGRLMQSMQPGAMLSVNATEAQLAPWINGPIELAAVNAHNQCVLAGPIDAIDHLQPVLTAMGWSATELQISHAFHSQMMQPMLAEFADTLAQIKWQVPHVAMLSSVTGQLMDRVTLTSAQYWLDNARHTVRFSQAVQTLLTQSEFQKQPPVLLEVGPGRTLTQLIKKHSGSNDFSVFTSLRHVKESTADTVHWLNTLGGLWTKGVNVHWQPDGDRSAITRVSLPGYVYQEKRHWVDADPLDAHQDSNQDNQAVMHASVSGEGEISGEGDISADQESMSHSKRDFEQWFYRPSWEQQSIFLATEIGRPIWILVPITDQAGVAALWSEQEVTYLTLADWSQPQWTSQIEAAMLMDQRVPVVIDYLSLSVPANSRDAFMVRLLLIQNLLNLGIGVAEITYLLVSEHLAVWSNADTVNPLLALPMGLLRVLQAEFPGMRCRAVDIASDAACVPRLLAEAMQPGQDTLVVWRNEQRWRQTFTPVVIPKACLIEQLATKVFDRFGRHDQPLLILVTGGLGGIGLTLAAALSKTFRCRFLVLSRRGGEVPQQLQTMGVDVRVAGVDVTDVDAMQQVIVQTEQAWGPIQAVIHAAGIAGGGMTAYLRAEDVDAVLSAKVQGARVLQQLLVDARPQQPLLFWMMCSSLASCVGLMGRSEYTAANLYLDLLATQLRYEKGINAVSINWDAWSGVGMAIEYVDDDRILPEEGASAFLRILSLIFASNEPIPQILVSTRDLNRLYFSGQPFDVQPTQQTYQTNQTNPKSQKSQKSQKNKTLPSLSASGGLLTPLQQQLKSLWEELLGVSQISLDANFFDLGGDSVVSLQLVSRAKTLGLNLKPQHVFDHPTLRQLAIALGDAPTQKIQHKVATQVDSNPMLPLHTTEILASSESLNPTEKKLQRIWCDLLGVDAVGLEDNFFDLGGDSVVSLQLVSRVKAEGLVLKPQQVFEYPTLRALASSLLQTQADAAQLTSSQSVLPQLAATQFSSEKCTSEKLSSEQLSSEQLPLVQLSSPQLSSAQLFSAQIFTEQLSSAQQRLWFLEQMDPGSALYCLRGALLWKNQGEAKCLNERVLRAALQFLIHRHEALRMGFTQSEGEPSLFLAEVIDVPLSVLTVALSEDADIEDDLRQRLNAPQAVFVLDRPPLWRIQLLCYSQDRYGLLLYFHHIIIDDWSTQIFLRELRQVIEAFAQSGSADALLPPITYRYLDFVHWQMAYRQSAAYQTDLQFWRQQLSDLTQLDLPLDKARPAKPSHQGGQLVAQLSSAQAAALRSFSQAQQVSLFMTLQAVVLVLLQRLSGQTQIVMGTPVADRPHMNFENILGIFVNNVVLKNNVDLTQTFSQLVKQLRITTLDAQSHQTMPFEDLVKVLQPVRDMSRAPIFQVLITYLNVQADKQAEKNSSLLNQKDGISSVKTMSTVKNSGEFKAISGFSGATEYDLSFYFTDHPSDGSLQIKCEYATDLFFEASITRYVEQWIFLCEQLISQASLPLKNVFTLPPSQWRQLSVEFNRTSVQWPTQNIVQLLSACAAQHPQSLAVKDDKQALTYQQLQARVHQWSHWLLQQNLATESCIGVCVQRQNELVVLLLAIWSAGYAYVPIDPNYPADRITHVLNDCQAPLLLIDSVNAEHIPALTGKKVEIEQVDLSNLPEYAPNVDIQPSQLAYVIYTSGSTGLPKGVQLEHGGLHNFMLAVQQKLSLNASDRLLAVTTVSFDIHLLELFLPLCLGASVYIADAATCVDGSALLKLIQGERITVMQATPATWQLLLESGWEKPLALTVLCGGEAISMSLTERLLPLCSALWNLYGPTETTVWSSVTPIRSLLPPITVGHPIANTQFYLLDAAFMPVPLGAAGELYIGGAGLSRGYLNLAEMTASRFITVDLPFVGKARVYATGDQARWLADGRLQMMGRLDSQIKLRGFRIELGEIEFQLTQYPGVQQAVVMVKEFTQGPALVAYWTGEKSIDVGKLRSFISQHLPPYMLPSYWVPMTQFPKTPNQKIDRKALPLPTQTGVSLEKNLSTVLSPAEQVVADIFKQVLNHPQVTAYDNFFDLGGHSLLSMKVVEALYQRTGIRIHPGEMFQQTVGQLAAYYGDALLPDARLSNDERRTAESALSKSETLSVVSSVADQSSGAKKKVGLLKRVLGMDA